MRFSVFYRLRYSRYALLSRLRPDRRFCEENSLCDRRCWRRFWLCHQSHRPTQSRLSHCRHFRDGWVVEKSCSKRLVDVNHCVFGSLSVISFVFYPPTTFATLQSFAPRTFHLFILITNPLSGKRLTISRDSISRVVSNTYWWWFLPPIYASSATPVVAMRAASASASPDFIPGVVGVSVSDSYLRTLMTENVNGARLSCSEDNATLCYLLDDGGFVIHSNQVHWI